MRINHNNYNVNGNIRHPAPHVPACMRGIRVRASSSSEDALTSTAYLVFLNITVLSITDPRQNGELMIMSVVRLTTS